MRDSWLKAKKVVMENTFMKTETSMKEIGSTIRKMARGYTPMPFLEKNTMETGLMAKKMEQEFLHSPQETTMKVSFQRVSKMGEETSPTLTEEASKEIGKMIRPLVKVS